MTQRFPRPIVAEPAGVVVLNKPVGISSRQAIDHVKRAAYPAKVGHAGTLDPGASGVLVVCVGAATRLIEYVQALPKRYTGAFLLGRSSPTEDLEGEVTEIADAPQPSLAQVEAAAAMLVGTIQQRPPAFSALKVNGQRAYALARRGREVELASRPVMIHSLTVVSYSWPKIVLEIECGSGTYVRSLGRDLGISLGSNAVMTDLVRTAIGPFTIDQATAFGSIDRGNLAQVLRPAADAAPQLPRVVLNDEQCYRAANGLAIQVTAEPTLGEIAAMDEAGRLVALLTWRPNGELRAAKSFMEQTPGRGTEAE